MKSFKMIFSLGILLNIVGCGDLLPSDWMQNKGLKQQNDVKTYALNTQDSANFPSNKFYVRFALDKNPVTAPHQVSVQLQSDNIMSLASYEIDTSPSSLQTTQNFSSQITTDQFHGRYLRVRDQSGNVDFERLFTGDFFGWSKYGDLFLYDNEGGQKFLVTRNGASFNEDQMNGSEIRWTDDGGLYVGTESSGKFYSRDGSINKSILLDPSNSTLSIRDGGNNILFSQQIGSLIAFRSCASEDGRYFAMKDLYSASTYLIDMQILQIRFSTPNEVLSLGITPDSCDASVQHVPAQVGNYTLNIESGNTWTIQLSLTLDSDQISVQPYNFDGCGSGSVYSGSATFHYELKITDSSGEFHHEDGYVSYKFETPECVDVGWGY